MKMTEIDFIFHGDLQSLLTCKQKGVPCRYQLNRRASIKDILESMGIPHTEVGRIEFGDEEIDFAFIPETDVSLSVFSFTAAKTQEIPSLLWPNIWRFDKFFVDLSVLKLGRNMRIAGFDTAVVPAVGLKEIAKSAADEKRVILTRNRELLKCADVEFGQLIRSMDHLVQFREVLDRFKLYDKMKVFSRCLDCNGELGRVEKVDILHLLEPLTRKYYNLFMRCGTCCKVYWRGSHHQEMVKIIEAIKKGRA